MDQIGEKLIFPLLLGLGLALPGIIAQLMSFRKGERLDAHDVLLKDYARVVKERDDLALAHAKLQAELRRTSDERDAAVAEAKQLREDAEGRVANDRSEAEAPRRHRRTE